MNKNLKFLLFLIVMICLSDLSSVSFAMAKKESLQKSAADPALAKKESKKKKKHSSYQDYIDYFEKVYDTMDKNYYQTLDRAVYDKFIEKFKTKIYPQLLGEKKSDDFVRWRSAAFLIDDLKAKEDIFSAFYPPEPAQEYKASVLDIRVDLGIEGEKTEEGFKVSHVEPRSDAYVQGLRDLDVILEIEHQDLRNLLKDDIQKLLNPHPDTKNHMKFLSGEARLEKEVEISPKDFFRQSVFLIPTGTPGIYGLRIPHFNRMTGEDMFRFLDYFRSQGPIMGLILDLRGNPGGPPLAAREILSFLLPPAVEFAYFQNRGEPKSSLDVPSIPSKYHYDGPLVVLIDSGSGSSSELFSGSLQKRNRAVLMGRNSAGQVMLKSMFNLDDGSMVLLVTGRGHHFDGSVFPFTGLIPDRIVAPENDGDIVRYAVSYLIHVNSK